MSAKICPFCNDNLQLEPKQAKHLFDRAPDDNGDLPCFECLEEEEENG